jgi:hypothetical protein
MISRKSPVIFSHYATLYRLPRPAVRSDLLAEVVELVLRSSIVLNYNWTFMSL